LPSGVFFARRELLWEYAVERDGHAVELAHSELADKVAAMLWLYGHGGPYELRTFEPATR